METFFDLLINCKFLKKDPSSWCQLVTLMETGQAQVSGPKVLRTTESVLFDSPTLGPHHGQVEPTSGPQNYPAELSTPPPSLP